MLSKVQFTFKVNSIDSLQGIEIEIHGASFLEAGVLLCMRI
jgi:hypothetical protein